MDGITKLIPLFAAVAVLLFLAIWMKQSPEATVGESPEKAAVLSIKSRRSATPNAPIVAADSSNQVSREVAIEKWRNTLPELPPREAADFPHNLNTFADWNELSVEDLRHYRVSLISRVGNWDAEKVSAFFFTADSKITDPAASAEFRNAILGVWCAKDVDGCLAQLGETMPAPDATVAKQEALAGWSSEDWMTALRYLQRNGDAVIDAKVGGDSTRFIRNIIREAGAAHGLEEAQGIVSQISGANNLAAAEDQLKILSDESPPATGEIQN